MINLPYRPNWAHEEITGRTPSDDKKLLIDQIKEMKEISIGEVVYYIKKNGNFDWSIDFGVLKDKYNTDVVLELYEVMETRLINKIPYNDFPSKTELKKLPKGWTYDTKLFEYQRVKIPEEMRKAASTTSIRDREGIKKLIDMGYFVSVSSIDHSHIDIEFVKHEGYRLIKVFYPYEYHPTTLTRRYWEIFKDYNEAKKYIDEHIAEMKFEANMSDLEWSVYQIDRVLDRASMYINNTQINLIRKHLLSMDNVENIEVRIFEFHIQWKYEKSKRWNNIDS